MSEMQDQMEKRLEQNSFMNYTHQVLELVEKDHAVFRMDIFPESHNSFGMVHGGVLYTLADNATGCAAHSDGRAYVTQGSSFSFLRNQPQGTIYAEARVRHRGGKTCLIDVDVTGDGGTLLATGSFTYFCVDRGKIEEKTRK